jgi:hypothetical protein
LRNGGIKLKDMKTNTTLQEDLVTLALEGYKSILIYYAGSGDSGSIEEILLHKKEFDIDDFEFYLHNSEGISLDNQIIKDNIEQFIMDNILDNIEDWYNNEGGDGTVYIKIPSGEYHVDNQVRLIDYINYKHEGNLFNL